MATYRQLKQFINSLTDEQLEVEVCAFDEDMDQVFWLTDEGMQIGEEGKPLLTGGTDFGQGYVKAEGRKWALPPIRKEEFTITLRPYVTNDEDEKPCDSEPDQSM